MRIDTENTEKELWDNETQYTLDATVKNEHIEMVADGVVAGVEKVVDVAGNISSETYLAIKEKLGVEGEISAEEFNKLVALNEITIDPVTKKVVRAFTPDEQAAIEKIEELKLLYGGNTKLEGVEGRINWEEVSKIAFTPCPLFESDCQGGPKYAINLLYQQIKDPELDELSNIDLLRSDVNHVKNQLAYAEATVGQAGNIAFGGSTLLRTSQGIVEGMADGTTVVNSARHVNVNPNAVDNTDNIVKQTDNPSRLTEITQEMKDNPYHPDWARYDGPKAVGADVSNLSGSKTKIPDRADSETKRSLIRENESAEILAQSGHKVEQNPLVDGPKNPDYKIDGDIYDNYAPSTSNVRNMWNEVSKKVAKGQTSNVVINLADSTADISTLKNQFENYPIDGLKNVIVITPSGTIVRLFDL